MIRKANPHVPTLQQLTLYIRVSIFGLQISLSVPVAQMVKNLRAMWEIWVQSLGGEDLLEKEMAAHSSIFAWRIPWAEELGGLQSMGFQRLRHRWVTNTNGHEFEQILGYSGQGSLVCCSSWGSQRVEHYLATERQFLWAKPVIRQMRNLKNRCLLSSRPFSSGKKIKEPWSKRTTSSEKEGETVPL